MIIFGVFGCDYGLVGLPVDNEKAKAIDMSDACCCIDVDEPADVHHTREIKRARKPHRCCECGRTIPVGSPYRYETACSDGRWDTYKTCTLCASIRDDRFPCGFYWTRLWEDLQYCMWAPCLCEGDCDCDTWLDPPDYPIEVAQ